MSIINEKDETVQSICVETPGGSELDLDTGYPHANCVLARLIQHGYTSASLESAYEKDWAALELFFGSGYPDRDIVNKMRPDCVRLVTIIQKCKF